jgi:hypothetical protein
VTGRRPMRVEDLRDNLLALAGTLERQPPDVDQLGQVANDREARPVRTVYLVRARASQPFWADYFELPRGFKSVGQRSDVPSLTQIAFFLEESWLIEIVHKIAAAYEPRGPSALDDIVKENYQRIYTRAPSDSELASWRQFFSKGDFKQNLYLFFQTLVSASEFYYL